jgi:hypothetical protein
MPFPFPDALQEFKVETSSLTAQNGLHSAGAVSAVVKSAPTNITAMRLSSCEMAI